MLQKNYTDTESDSKAREWWPNGQMIIEVQPGDVKKWHEEHRKGWYPDWWPSDRLLPAPSLERLPLREAGF